MDRRRAVALLLWTFLTPCGVWAADQVRVGGTGSGSALLERLAAAFRAREPGISVTVVMPPLGSGGALRAFGAGRLDVAIIARPLQSEESRGLVVREFARTAQVLATRDGARAGGFTRAELADLLDGRITTWDDGRRIRLILRHEQDSDYLTLQGLSPEVAAALARAVRRPGMVFAEHDLEAIELLSRTTGSVGTTTLGLIKLTEVPLRVLPVDGETPTLETLATGRYPLVKRLFLVVSATPGPGTRRFVEFLLSGPAREMLRQYDLLPVASQ